MRYSSSILLFSAILVILELSNASVIDNATGNQDSVSQLHFMGQGSQPLVSSAEDYLNHSLAEEVYVTPIYPSNPAESRSIWQRSNNESMNFSIYLDLMELVWIQYMEDLNYSSYILDEFVKKKIDGRAAMTSTMALFTLTSQTVDMLDKIKPSRTFMQYHNYTLDSLINLEGYLWNMAKFYETNRRVYAMQAHDNFNQSMIAYEKGSDIYKQIKK